MQTFPLKRIKIIVIFIVFVISGYAHPHRAKAEAPQVIKGFIETTPARKLSSALQKQLLEIEETEKLDQGLDLILSLKGSLTPDARSLLEKQGIIIRTVIGTVATVTALAEEVPSLARFDFVESVELPRTLRPKKDENEKE